jgi:hypothetical protein
MNNLKPRRSIDSYGGIIPYLNATAVEHGGLTGDKFAEYVRIGLSDPKIATQTGNSVTASAVKNWRRRLRDDTR